MNLKQKISEELSKYVRIWRIMKKPTKEELKVIAKVSSIGLLLIGLVGFLISLIIKEVIR
ncbi:MAG: protein translocase SEC61 complex subunit gamma [Candidatus Pacearchaeota archaeon]